MLKHAKSSCFADFINHNPLIFYVMRGNIMLKVPYLVSHSWESPGSSKQTSDQFSLISEQGKDALPSSSQ